MTGRTKADRRDAGFTLAEMLVVLTIMGFIGVAVSTSAVFRRDPSTRDLARSIASQARSVSMLAMTTATNRALVVSPRERLVTGRPGHDPLHVLDSYDLRLETASDLVGKDGTGRILFFPDGTSTGGRIAIMRPDGQGHAVAINWLTGAVTTETVE